MINFRDIAYVGKNRIPVTKLGLGCLPLGYLYKAVAEEEALKLVRETHNLGIRFFDTAILYGATQSERRLGEVLPSFDRDSFSLATKVGYDVSAYTPDTVLPPNIPPRSYDYDFIMKSVEASLKRLKLDYLDIVHIHDPDDLYSEAMNGAYKALDLLRTDGLIKAVGAGMNQSAMLTQFAKNGDFDCFLLAGRYSLLDQSALKDLLPVALQKNIAIIAGGVFNSGLLTNPYSDKPMFNYRPAESDWVKKAQQIDVVCREFKVPLMAAAIQFPYAHPAITSVVIGAGSLDHLKQNINMLEYKIPPELWTELKKKKLINEIAPVPKE
ncbi:MAG: aldo/keto reductase [Deltaproteobacteria bacterium]|jgi:D-threo-aldose 1-dehydrogenase|nr:aldo/keto reductase [Deltaproteobacteria bacterium]